MRKFMCLHTLPPGQIGREQVDEIAKAAQTDPLVRGYRSFMNLAEGKFVCIFEAPDKVAVETWFTKMRLPYDSIVEVELEGERGNVKEAVAAEELAVI